MTIVAMQQSASAAKAQITRLAIVDLTQSRDATEEHALIRQQSITTLVGLGWTVEQIAAQSRLDVEYVVSALVASLSASMVQLVYRLNPSAPFSAKDHL